MSWKAYIDSLKAEKGVGEGAIFGSVGGVLSLWASSPGFIPTVEEVTPFTKSENELRSKSVFLAGEKYIMLRYEPEETKNDMVSVQLKKTKKDGDDHAYSASVFKTTKNTLIIARAHKDGTGPDVAAAARKQGLYLDSTGY